jgi:predicted PurR-regulated permease PerM
MQKNYNIRLANLTLGLICLLITGYLLQVGKPVFLPLLFSVLVSFLLYPLCKRLESWKLPRILATFLAMLTAAGMITAFVYIFSRLFSNLDIDYQKFGTKIQETFYKIADKFDKVPYVQDHLDEIIKEGSTKLISLSQDLVGSTITSSTLIIGYIGMSIVYIFLFLLYRTSFKEFIISQFEKEKQHKAELMLYRFQSVTQSYFVGLFLATLILGSITTIGLAIIGIDNAFLFGFFGGFLSVVPYIGTTIGGLLPFLYALLNYDETWRAVAVVIMYQCVQTIEGNFITPKIVGSNVSINPLVAIFVLILGGVFWGIAGMVLSLPVTAIIKVLLEYSEHTKPYAHLLSNEFSKKADLNFKLKYDWKKMFIPGKGDKKHKRGNY